MNKKVTQINHSKLSNNLINYVYCNIEIEINIDILALEYGISKNHLHKIFKEQTGITIYKFIKSVRLQKASNMLISNKSSTITKIANLCGYSVQTSFIRAFKQRFGQSPKSWRNGGYKDYSNSILPKSISYKDFSHVLPNIVTVKAKKAYYLRQKGYLYNGIRTTWQKMFAWTFSNNVNDFEQIGLFHDNPLITPLESCEYVACIVPKEGTVIKKSQNLPTFKIYPAVCITFDFEGNYGDILELIRWVNHHWLPTSGFEIPTIPSYTIFEKNDSVNDREFFKGTYYIPVESIL